MSMHESERARPVWLFMVATAMATTVSTLAATSMVKSEASEAVAVTCACAPLPAAAPELAAPPAMAEDPQPVSAPEAFEPILDQAVDPPRAEPTNTDQRVIAARPVPEAKVEGGLPQPIIRRIVKAHINEVRYCYNEGLRDDPELSGRVVVAFTIGSEGRVTNSEVSSTTLTDSGVPECITGAVARWMFPKPSDGASVQVTYPFVLEPG